MELPAPEADGTSPSNGGLHPQSPLQPPPAEQAQIATPHHARARADEQGAVSFSLRMQYRGEERTTEIPLTHDMMRQLAIEAWLRDMKIGEVVSELIVAVFKRDLFTRCLIGPGRNPRRAAKVYRATGLATARVVPDQDSLGLVLTFLLLLSLRRLPLHRGVIRLGRRSIHCFG